MNFDHTDILLRVILAHIIADFFLQRASWIQDRRERHIASGALWVHGLIHGMLTWLLAGGWIWGWLALLIFFTHILIDTWKSYRPGTWIYFALDQIFHLLIILFGWAVLSGNLLLLLNSFFSWFTEPDRLIILLGMLLVLRPAGFIIQLLTNKFREQIGEDTEGLNEAGKWIGYTERFLGYIFILTGQYTALGLLVAAKSILRIGADGRHGRKLTEYVLIGTLLSITTALVTGLFVVWLMKTN